MTAVRRWQELTTRDFGGLDPERTVAVLPVGAVEQHGPHLPVAVDALVAEAVAERALAWLPAEVPALLLPLLPVGKSNEHIDYGGTLTLSAETLMRLWLEVGESVARAGVRKLVFLNSHGGQPQVMEIVARELRVRRRMLCVACSWWQMGLPEGLFDPQEVRHGIHGGDIETSIVLALRPDLVRMERAENFRPVTLDIEPHFERLRYLGGPVVGWQAQDLHPAGVAGDATRATAEKGEALLAHVAAGFATLVREVSAYPLSSLVARDPG